MSTPIQNQTDLWQSHLPRPSARSHKYNRGHAVIFAAAELTGASRLAATACLRVGAGLVTVIAPEKADIFRITLPPDIMIRENLTEEIRNIRATLMGPGGSIPDRSAGLDHEIFRIIDAGALPFDGDFSNLNERCVLTPHDGEFERCFPELTGDRLERAQRACKLTGSYIVLKGPQTIIASPDGRTCINTHASPWLSKAGTGDVLAGMITGLLAQLDAAETDRAFEMVCAAIWMHGEAGRRLGPGLIASDLEKQLPEILATLLRR